MTNLTTSFMNNLIEGPVPALFELGPGDRSTVRFYLAPAAMNGNAFNNNWMAQFLESFEALKGTVAALTGGAREGA